MQPEQPTQAPTGIGTRLIRLFAPATKACYTHGSLVVVCNEQDEFLLVRQRTREHGRWGLPGGFLGRGEQPVDGAVRELSEETGVLCKPDQLVPLMEYKQPWASHYDHLFGLRVQGDGESATRRLEIAERRWFTATEEPPLTAAANEVFLRISTADILRIIG